MDVRQIVKNNLILMGFDGLCSDECGCQVSDLMPCDYGEDIALCVPGYKHPAPEDDPEGCTFYIKPEKPEGHEGTPLVDPQTMFPHREALRNMNTEESK